MSSYEFMRSHESKFDEKLSKLARNEACGLSRFAGMSKSKVHRGIVGSGLKDIPQSLVCEIDFQWKTIIEPVLGYNSYDQLRKANM
jgi:hypothetical protein